MKQLPLLIVVVCCVTSLGALVVGCERTQSTDNSTEKQETMQLGYMLFYVADVDATLTFFTEAFGVERKFYSVEGEEAYGELNTGATTLGFVSHTLARSQGIEFQPNDLAELAPPVDIGFVTDDVPAAYDRAIAAGCTCVAEPKVKPWGQTVAYVREINGFLVGINTPMPPAE